MMGKLHLMATLKTKRILDQRFFLFGGTNRIALTPDFCDDCREGAHFFDRAFAIHFYTFVLLFMPLQFSRYYFMLLNTYSAQKHIPGNIFRETVFPQMASHTNRRCGNYAIFHANRTCWPAGCCQTSLMNDYLMILLTF